MSENEVICIPTEPNIILGKKRSQQLRVASYCRVSTDAEEQLTSFESQKLYYTDFINRTPGWKLVGTYADEGISGALAKKRPAFMNMIRQCKKGKIDLIITKSISRFARNTVDSIKYVRILKAMGIGVIFEKEGINTIEENSEVLLTIFSSFAQEELNSLSMNVKMGIRMGMKEGKISFVKLYGYQKNEDGNAEINQDEAKIVKRIYKLYLDGITEKGITDILESENIKSNSSNGIWNKSKIKSILTNERYSGDVILQKTYITDPISKKSMKNNGELPKYLVKNAWPAIVSKEIFDMAQTERAKRSSKPKISKNAITETGKYSKYALSEILVCGKCLSPYRRVSWTKRNGDKIAVWRCINRLENGRKYCDSSPSIDEETLQDVIMEAINELRGDRKELTDLLVKEIEKEIYIKESKVNVIEIENQIEILKTNVMKLIKESIATNTVTANEDKLKSMNDEIKTLNMEVEKYKEKNEKEFNNLKNLEKSISSDVDNLYKYDDVLVRKFIDKIMVISNEKIEIKFKNGNTTEKHIDLKIRQLKYADKE